MSDLAYIILGLTEFGLGVMFGFVLASFLDRRGAIARPDEAIRAKTKAD